LDENLCQCLCPALSHRTQQVKAVLVVSGSVGTAAGESMML
jgi:hypothetical protein